MAIFPYKESGKQFKIFTDIKRVLISSVNGYDTSRLYFCSYYNSMDDFNFWFEIHLK